MIFNVLLSNSDMVATVDADFKDLVGQYRWFINQDGYVMSSKKISLHRLVMGVPKGSVLEVDHINCDKLDNRICNLRVCTHSQNVRNVKAYKNNRSGYKGVHFHYGKFVAGIRLNKKRIHLGRFTSVTEAALAYDRAAKELHGEFARLNFPELA